MTARSSVKDAAWSAYVWPKGRLGNRVQGAVIGALESHRMARAWERADRILLVHTPGKVGSKAMVAALKACRRPTDVIFHTHRMNPDNVIGLEWERTTLAPRRTWYTTDFLGQRLRQPHTKDVVVLAAVRDPVERGLSAFIQNIERYVDSGRPITAVSQVNTDDLTRRFIAHFDPASITQWVEWELNAMFGVDLFAKPFDHALGYQVEDGNQVRVGVIRHDRFDDGLTPFIHALTELDPPPVGRVNDSSSKASADTHRTMRESMRLPAQLVDEIYSTAYARHFFTETERRHAMTRWAEQPAA